MEPQPKVAQKRSRVEGAALCHFDRREKSFSDPSRSLGMTGLVPSLGGLGVLARANAVSDSEGPLENLRKPQKTYRNTKTSRSRFPFSSFLVHSCLAGFAPC